MKLPTIMREPQRGLAPRTARSQRTLAGKRSEPCVLELTGRRVQRFGVPAHQPRELPQTARRPLRVQVAAEFVVVAGAVDFELAARTGARGACVGDVFGND